VVTAGNAAAGPYRCRRSMATPAAMAVAAVIVAHTSHPTYRISDLGGRPAVVWAPVF
jgi:hypothetical protein